MKVAILTQEQKDLLSNVQYITDIYFRPLLDGDGNWYISIEEQDGTTNPDFLWVKDLPLIDFKQPIWD